MMVKQPFFGKTTDTPLVLLLRSLGKKIAYDTSLHVDYKVKMIVNGNIWRWSIATSTNLIKVKSLVNFMLTREKDRIIWLLKHNDKFSINSTQNEIKYQGIQVSWSNIVWHKNSILRHSLILWMVIKGKLPTRIKLAKLGVVSSANCVLSNEKDEDLDYLFF